jgi:hypothetical protein
MGVGATAVRKDPGKHGAIGCLLSLLDTIFKIDSPLLLDA